MFIDISTLTIIGNVYRNDFNNALEQQMVIEPARLKEMKLKVALISATPAR